MSPTSIEDLACNFIINKSHLNYTIASTLFMQWYTKTGHKNVVAVTTQTVKRLPQDLTKSLFYWIPRRPTITIRYGFILPSSATHPRYLHLQAP